MLFLNGPIKETSHIADIDTCLDLLVILFELHRRIHIYICYLLKGQSE